MQRGLPQAGALVAEKYVITQLLGRGGMGAVYVVEHRVTGKRLALKCLLPEHAEHPEFIERFLREAQAAGRIQHRNVVDVFDVGRDGELVYIVMELLDGKSLADLLREGQLTLEETLQIVLRAMEGVAAAHKVGIVHRDLKPDNIFVAVGQSGRLDDPRVLDFGISKLEDDASKPLTKSGVMLGTPYYMAFEQINSQRDLDQRVDVYAMGVILYEAISGQPPYVAESVGALAIRMMSAPPVPLSQHRPELPQGLTDVVMRSIARDRDQRFPTMQALIEALRPYASDRTSLLLPRGEGTPLGISVRSATGNDKTLPAMAATPAAPSLKSSARLKLHASDDNRERTPSIAGSSKTLLWVAGAGLAVIIAAVSLVLALRDPDASEEVPVATEAPPLPRAPAKREAVEAPAAAEATKAAARPSASPPEARDEPAQVVAEPDALAAEDELNVSGKTRGKRKVVRGKNGKVLPTTSPSAGAQASEPSTPAAAPAAAPAPAAATITPAAEATPTTPEPAAPTTPEPEATPATAEPPAAATPDPAPSTEPAP
jgi:eukaryotic-like serine/threonine-protein kinase